jgi:uncharacterized protein YoaH (UPF0181 family)
MAHAHQQRAVDAYEEQMTDSIATGAKNGFVKGEVCIQAGPVCLRALQKKSWS